ncbi:hypothetical protein J6590_078406 [Homalodisca vitripennis]|nr:hypothetical protein J6590_078406 [Homalodisca vitripennis]
MTLCTPEICARELSWIRDFTTAKRCGLCAYLVSKYGKDDSLYPRDLRKRAIVDQRLHYSNDVVYVLEISLVIQHCFCSRPIMTYLVSKYGKDDSLYPQRSARSIMTYLVSKYGKDDSLYPRDLRKRAIVDQRLHYSNDVFYVLELSLVEEEVKSVLQLDSGTGRVASLNE